MELQDLTKLVMTRMVIAVEIKCEADRFAILKARG